MTFRAGSCDDFAKAIIIRFGTRWLAFVRDVQNRHFGGSFSTARRGDDRLNTVSVDGLQRFCCSLDKISRKPDTLIMFRKCLALLLVLAWVVLFGTVIFENLAGFGSQFHRSAHALTWSAKPAAVPIDDTDDSTDGTPHSQCKRVRAATAEPAIGLTGLQRCFKLHKIHQVFLI
jgi:hypothetical protein